ncbi:putative glucan endo-1,3-beta-glucosidase eglC [Sarocladium implicatum]|nr:putative glucan endo-1,3-beta-glucosidase eglC [Sarocladium implicatum]
MRFTLGLVASALAATASAADGKNYLGFNSGAENVDKSAKFKKDFVAEFQTAQDLKGAPGTFNAVRLYTNIQAYSEDDPIEAFEAAIDTKTHILLGVWASGTDNIDKELSALNKAVKKFGKDFTDLVIGISIGSEDLYRDSVTGRKNDPDGLGNSPEAIVGFIEDYKKAFAGTALGKIPVGHVDTWDVWPNSTVKPVIDAVDFVGLNEFPYYENDKGNDIKRAGILFDNAYETAKAAVGDKPMWITETGWPVSGIDWDEAEPSVKNAKYYWDEVGCRQLFNKVPTFWYILRDSNGANKQKFGITKDLSTTPLFDLSCPAKFDTPKLKASESATTSAEASSTHAAKSSTAAPSASTTGSSSDEEDADKTTTGAPEQTSGSASEGSSGSGSSSDDSGNSGNSDNSQDGDEPETTDEGAASGFGVSALTFGSMLVAAVVAVIA